MATKFDAIVVGAGPAGATAAYRLAEAGIKTLLVERGRGRGSKQVFGCRIYVTPVREVFPDVEKTAPIHRWVKREKISILHNSRILSLEYESPEKHSFITYLTEFTSWIVDKAINAGAVYVDEVRVDSIVEEDGRIIGIEAGGERIEASIVIDAEGVNRLLLEKLGLAERLSPEEVALGAKEVIKVGADKINERFGLEEDSGLAWLLVGEPTDYLPGGAFIYTNRDSVSIGVVVYLATAVKKAREEIYRLVEKLRLHPQLRQYWEDGDIIEYSAHLTIESGRRFMPRKLATSGLIVVGDAAGLLLNTGYTFRGVDYAVYSGYLAAEAAKKAFSLGDFSEETLRENYEKKLLDSFIAKDLRNHTGVEQIMHEVEFFEKYPVVAIDTARKLFELGYETPRIQEALRSSLKTHHINLLSFLYKMFKMVRKL